MQNVTDPLGAIPTSEGEGGPKAKSHYGCVGMKGGAMVDELHRKWRAYWDEFDRIQQLNRTLPHHRRLMLPFPEELRGMTCGAKTRAGTPCKQKGLYRSGRCKLHGGLSTGPKTKAGKKHSAANGKKKHTQR